MDRMTKSFTIPREIQVDGPAGTDFYPPLILGGQIAQSVEQRTENPCVPSSILGLATTGMKTGGITLADGWKIHLTFILERLFN